MGVQQPPVVLDGGVEAAQAKEEAAWGKSKQTKFYFQFSSSFSNSQLTSRQRRQVPPNKAPRQRPIKIVKVDIGPDEAEDGGGHEEGVQEEEEGADDGDQMGVGEAEEEGAAAGAVAAATISATFAATAGIATSASVLAGAVTAAAALLVAAVAAAFAALAQFAHVLFLVLLKFLHFRKQQPQPRQQLLRYQA